MKILIVGQPNVGKTLFIIQMIKKFGADQLTYTILQHNGQKYKKKIPIDEGIAKMVSSKANHTLNIHDFSIKIKKGKGKIEIFLMDSCGVLPIIHPLEHIRDGIAQTLQHFKQVSAIFHVMDSSTYVADNLIDQEIYDFGLQQCNYLILANKIDLDSGKLSIPRIKNDYSKAIVLPFSAKTGEGLEEVKKYVYRLI